MALGNDHTGNGWWTLLPGILIPITVFLLPLIYYAGRFTSQLETITGEVNDIRVAIASLRDVVTSMDKVMAGIVSTQVRVGQLADRVTIMETEMEQRHTRPQRQDGH